MRKIKFRAWDKEKKRWVKRYDFIADVDESADTDYIWEYLLSVDGNCNVALSNEGFLQICFSEYTGLKDSQGKEIYFGDIVMDTELGNYKMVVGDIWVSNKIIDLNKCNNTMSGVIIVGNIYENPELLRNKNE